MQDPEIANVPSEAPPRNGRRSPEAVPEGLWSKCPKCGEMLYQPELEEALYVCRHCGSHHRLRPATASPSRPTRERLSTPDAGLTTSNPLGFPGYEDLVAEDRAQRRLRIHDLGRVRD